MDNYSCYGSTYVVYILSNVRSTYVIIYWSINSLINAHNSHDKNQSHKLQISFNLKSYSKRHITNRHCYDCTCWDKYFIFQTTGPWIILYSNLFFNFIFQTQNQKRPQSSITKWRKIPRVFPLWKDISGQKTYRMAHYKFRNINPLNPEWLTYSKVAWTFEVLTSI